MTFEEALDHERIKICERLKAPLDWQVFRFKNMLGEDFGKLVHLPDFRVLETNWDMYYHTVTGSALLSPELYASVA